MSKQNYLNHVRGRSCWNSWLDKAEPHHKWMTVNNSSWHMSIFPQYHSNIEEVHRKLRHEEEDPMSYSTTSIVWDIQADKEIYVWHELNELPTSTPEDIRILDEEVERVRKEKEEKERAQKELIERNTRIAQQTQERKTTLEERYKLYVKKCTKQEVQPIPFYEYE
jgi:hypothetical protein